MTEENKTLRQITIIVELLNVDLIAAKKEGWSISETIELTKHLLEHLVMEVPRNQRAVAWYEIIQNVDDAIIGRTNRGE